jgi:hypothetical protein
MADERLTLDAARRILVDPVAYLSLLRAAAERLATTTLDDDALTVELLHERRGIRKGLNTAASYLVQAQMIVSQAKEDADEAHEALSLEGAPDSLVDVYADPVRPPT